MPDPWTERMQPHTPRTNDYRTPEELDYARVVHSEAFRRLSGVTQILAVQDSDFSRNRLTHTIEVSQVALGIVQSLTRTVDPELAQVLPSRALMQTVAAVHDIGHAPLGHGGEVALNFLLREHGGFEGNGQTLRILTKLMSSSTARTGGNLTRRTLLGALKYPVPWSKAIKAPPYQNLFQDKHSPATGRPLLVEEWYTPPKCYLDSETRDVRWLLSPLSGAEQVIVTNERIKSLDCAIMDLADDFSYSIADLEDAIHLRLLSRDQLEADVPCELWADFLESVDVRGTLVRKACEAWFDDLFGTKTKSCIGKLIHYAVNSVRMTTDERFQTDLYHHRVELPPAPARLIAALKKSVLQRVILAPTVQQMRTKGQAMIIDVFSALAHDPTRLLPVDIQTKWREADDKHMQMRVIGDYVAALTDAGLARLWRRLFDPTSGSAFDSLR